MVARVSLAEERFVPSFDAMERPSLRALAVHAFYNLRLILGCLLLGLMFGVGAAVMSPAQFTADALILIQPDAGESARQGVGGPAGPAGADAAQRIVQSDVHILLVRSEETRAPVARRVAETVLAAGGDLLGFVYAGRRRYVPEALYRWL